MMDRRWNDAMIRSFDILKYQMRDNVSVISEMRRDIEKQKIVSIIAAVLALRMIVFLDHSIEPMIENTWWLSIFLVMIVQLIGNLWLLYLALENDLEVKTTLMLRLSIVLTAFSIIKDFLSIFKIFSASNSPFESKNSTIKLLLKIVSLIINTVFLVTGVLEMRPKKAFKEGDNGKKIKIEDDGIVNIGRKRRVVDWGNNIPSKMNGKLNFTDGRIFINDEEIQNPRLIRNELARNSFTKLLSESISLF